jgi:hypothetical protein
MVLVGLLRWHACMLRELPSGELLYRSYRLSSMNKSTMKYTIFDNTILQKDYSEIKMFISCFVECLKALS